MKLPLHVLMIEDSEDDAELILHYLQYADFNVISQRVEEETSMQTALNQKKWDVVISDYHLPTFSAPEALKILQDSGQDIPFIVVSGTITEETALTLMRAGAADYLMKDRLARLPALIRRELNITEVRRERLETQAALLESETLFRTLFEQSPYGVVLFDPDTILPIAFNKTAHQQLGYTYEEFSQLHVSDYEAQEKAEDTHSHTQKVLTESWDEFETKHRTKQGEIRDVRVSVRKIELSGKQILHSIFQDITELKQSEIALRESEARFKRIADSAPGIIFRFDLQPTFHLSYINPAIEALTGLSPQECYASYQHLIERIQPEDAKHLIETLQSPGQIEEPVTIRWHGKDGLTYWLENRIVKVKGEDGQLAFIEGITRDITERKKLEDTQAFLAKHNWVKTEEDFFKAMARHLGDTLEMDYVCIDRLEGEGLSARTVAIYFDGKFEDNVSYTLKDTPCGEVAGKRICCFPQNVRQLFPKDAVLQDMAAESYAGVTLWGADGSPIGLIAVIGRQPLVKPDLAHKILELVAVPAASELERRKIEDERHESEERFSQAMEATSDGLWDWNIQTGQIYYSPNYLRMLGYEDHTLNNDPQAWEALIHPEDLARALGANQACIENRCQNFSVEFRMKAQDGAWKWILSRGKAIKRDEKGQALRLIGTHLDITERKLAEEKLRRSEERLSLALHSAGAGVWDWDIINDRLVWDDQMYRLYGVKKENFAGAYQAWLKGIHPDDAARSNEVSERSRRGEIEYDTEFRVIWPDGSLHYLKAYGQFERDQDGKPVRMIGINYDVTAKIVAEQNYQMLFKEMLDGFALHEIIVDAQGQAVDYRFLSVNPAFERMTGLKEADIKGRSVLEVLPETEPIWIKRYGQVALTGEPAFFENYSQEIGKYFEVTAYRPAPKQFACIFVDITQRKRAELDLKSAYTKLDALWSIAKLEDANVKTVADHILTTITQMTDSDYGFYGFINQDETVMTIHSWSGKAMENCSMVERPIEFIISESGVWAESIRRREPLLLNHYEEPHEAKKGLPIGHVPLTKLLVVPHFAHGKINSVAAVANRATDYTLEDISQIQTFLTSIQALVDSKKTEEALRISEQNFREIFNSTSEAIFIDDAETGQMLDVNETMLKLYGYENKEQVLAGTIGDLSVGEAPFTNELAQDLVRRAVEEGPQIFEWLAKKRDGTRFWSEVSLCRSQIGGKSRVLAVVRDITDRKRVEEALRKSEEQYHLIDEASQDFIYSYDTQGRFTHANTSLCKLLGLPLDQIIGKTHQELGFPQALCDEWDRLHRQVYQSNTTVISETVTPIQEGQLQYFEVVLNPIHDEAGNIIGIAGTTRDINTRKIAEAKIQEQLEELRRWHNITLGREERILELKREINQLLTEIGKPARYASVLEAPHA
jgi:PAS domain S-box-containing protein